VLGIDLKEYKGRFLVSDYWRSGPTVVIGLNICKNMPAVKFMLLQISERRRLSLFPAAAEVLQYFRLEKGIYPGHHYTLQDAFKPQFYQQVLIDFGICRISADGIPL